MHNRPMYLPYCFLSYEVTEGADALPAVCILLLVILWWVSSSNQLTSILSTFHDTFLPFLKFLGGIVPRVRCLVSHSFRGRSPNGNVKSVTLRTCCTPVSHSTADDFSLDLYSFFALVFPRKLVDTSTNEFQANFSSPVIILLKYSSLNSICGPMKTPSFTLASLRRGNFLRRYKNASPVLSIAFTKFFMRPSFTWRAGSITLLDSTSGSWFTFSVPGWSDWRQSFCFCSDLGVKFRKDECLSLGLGF